MLTAHNKHQVTTAGSIEGWEIIEHLGVVASHLVAGTGFVSDFFASFSDLFGGRSGTYRRQLESLYRDTTDDLIRQAHARGGNWLIGLRIDLDEVSGKGAQMFMITGLATVVRANRQESTANDGRTMNAPVSVDEVRSMTQRLLLMQRLENPDYSLLNSDWEILITGRVVDACPFIFAKYEKALKWRLDQVALRQRVLTFLSCLESPDATKWLFRALTSEETSAAAVDLIVSGDYGDLQAVHKLMTGPDPANRRRAMQVLVANQPQYFSSDITIIDSLISIIPSAFPNGAKEVYKKGLLGAQKKSWRCICGEDNALGDELCERCGRDRAGFTSAEVSPQKAILHLAALRQSLTAILNK